MPETDWVIDVKNLRKSFRNVIAVQDFSLKVRRGEIIGFLGPNGSGKTTTLKMLCGLLTPDNGEGTCLNLDLIRASSQIRTQVGYMTQSFSLYGYLTVVQNLHFMADAFSISDARRKVFEVMEKMDLLQRQHQRAEMLSGGWKQRLALAAAVLHQPRLLLLDEPTAGVDPKERHHFWDVIRDLSDKGTTIMVSTHYMDEAERCHRIAYLAYGKLLTEGSIHDIIQQARLHTWRVGGNDLDELGRQLQALEGVDQIIPFGPFLHISGVDGKQLNSSLRPYILNLSYQWKGIEPTLEDVFIHLLSKTKESRFD